MNTVLVCDDLGKSYRIGSGDRYRALRDVIARIPQAVTKRRGARKDLIWALKDVNLSVGEGEVVGLIGRNGAGKTTLLKVLARITKPTVGKARVRGRVGSLLEVGTGFHPELSGRENVYLSGAILGMNRATIRAKFDEIITFAGTESFVDTPLKRYSVGMQTRLAFAVAAHLEPDILLVDEVLAVGDLEFQKRCLGRMQAISETGRTLLFVSHQMNQIRRLCPRSVWLDGGQILADGPTHEVIAAYEEATQAVQKNAARSPRQKAEFQQWNLEPGGQALDTAGPVKLAVRLAVHKPVRRVYHGIALFDLEGQLMWAAPIENLSLDPGELTFRYEIPELPLRPGTYRWFFSLYDDEGVIDTWDATPDFVIATPPYYSVTERWVGLLNLPCGFSMEKGQ